MVISWAEHGYVTRLGSIDPAAILTPMSDRSPGGNDERDVVFALFGKEVARARMGATAEVAQVAFYLASGEPSYVTGAECVIDSGIMAGSTALRKESSCGP